MVAVRTCVCLTLVLVVLVVKTTLVHAQPRFCWTRTTRHVWPTARNGTLSAECPTNAAFHTIGVATVKPIVAMAQMSSTVQPERVQSACCNATTRDVSASRSSVTDSTIAVTTRTSAIVCKAVRLVAFNASTVVAAFW